MRLTKRGQTVVAWTTLIGFLTLVGFAGYIETLGA